MCCNNEDDYWDCPTCHQPMPPEVDRVCDCCDRRVSHHISVQSMCRVIREWKRRADEAEAENKKLKEFFQLVGETVIIPIEQELARLDREQMLRGKAWPFDQDPFTSEDHDNDHKYP